MDQSLSVCRKGDVAHAGPVTAPRLAEDLAAPVADPAPAPGKKGRAALLWGAASAILSGVGFVALALFEQYNGMVNEMRNDLKHFNETQSNYVKREHFDKLKDKLRDNFREFHEARAARVQMEQELKVSEKARTDMAQELQRLRERLAYVEGRQVVATPMAEPRPPAGN
jgi:septal ring factor EnvC (AmiA/AmiB activator)